MASIAGFGQDAKEYVLILDGFFLLAVFFTAATTHNLNIFLHGWNIINNVFFIPAAGINQAACANIFSGFSSIAQTSTSTGGLVALFGGIVNAVITLLNLIIGFILFIINFIAGCGFGAVLLLIGWAIILTNIYYFFRFLFYIRGS